MKTYIENVTSCEGCPHVKTVGKHCTCKIISKVIDDIAYMPYWCPVSAVRIYIEAKTESILRMNPGVDPKNIFISIAPFSTCFDEFIYAFESLELIYGNYKDRGYHRFNMLNIRGQGKVSVTIEDEKALYYLYPLIMK